MSKEISVDADDILKKILDIERSTTLSIYNSYLLLEKVKRKIAKKLSKITLTIDAETAYTYLCDMFDSYIMDIQNDKLFNTPVVKQIGAKLHVNNAVDSETFKKFLLANITKVKKKFRQSEELPKMKVIDNPNDEKDRKIYIYTPENDENEQELISRLLRSNSSEIIQINILKEKEDQIKKNFFSNYLKYKRKSPNDKIFEEEYIRLIMKYSILGLNRGNFWSMHENIYNFFSENSNRPCLECFSSPFNNNLKNFCTLFVEDSIFGSRGNFFYYLEHIKIPLRLFVNPPYTVEILDASFIKTYDYIKANPESDAILMYPYWHMVCYHVTALEKSSNRNLDDPFIEIITYNTENLENRPHFFTDVQKRETLRIRIPIVFYIIRGIKCEETNMTGQDIEDIFSEIKTKRMEEGL